MSIHRKFLPNKTRFNWRMVRRNKLTVSLCARFMFFSATALAISGAAMAAPSGGVVTGGAGTITQDGTATNINQTSHRLDIDWQTFSSGVNESINFFQPNASAVAINRVIGGVPSHLRGALNANGRVFILNESGIIFHGTSQVNVGSVMATTANAVTVEGNRFKFSGGGYGQVINKGTSTFPAAGSPFWRRPMLRIPARSGPIWARFILPRAARIRLICAATAGSPSRSTAMRWPISRATAINSA